jgi:hypothetical protein
MDRLLQFAVIKVARETGRTNKIVVCCIPLQAKKYEETSASADVLSLKKSFCHCVMICTFSMLCKRTRSWNPQQVSKSE